MKRLLDRAALIAPCCMTVLLASGCGGYAGTESGEETTSETVAPLYEASGVRLFTQNNNIAHVCFLPALDPHAPDFTAVKHQIQDAINNTWARYSALTFEGFENCPSSVPANWITWRLAQGTTTGSWGGNTAIGMGNRHGADDPQAQITQTIASDGSMTKTVAVHEVGHAIGWMHEHQRPNRPDISSCLKDLGTSPTDGNVVVDASGIQLTDYDPDSIMNYCRDRNHDGHPDLFDEPSLTARDILGLQQVYGRKRSGVLVGMNNACVDIPNNTTPPIGLNLQVYNCYGGDNQVWSYTTANKKLLATKVTNGNSAMDIENASTAPGTAVQVYTAQGTQANQQWNFSGVQIFGVGNLCFDRPGSDNRVQLYGCNGGNNQRWDVLPQAGAHSVRIRLAGTSTCIVAPVNAVSGTDLQLATCTTSPNDANQVFNVTALGELQGRGLCFDSEFGDAVNGRTMQLYACKGAGPAKLNQQFTFAGAVTTGLGTCLTAGSSDFQSRDPLQSSSCSAKATAPFNWEYYPAP